MATPPGDATGSINWQQPATTGGNDAARTTRTATFNADGREFTVTVSYSRQAVMAKYGVSDAEVDATMEQVITRIGADQLKNLAGHSISTSLQNVDQLQYRSSTESSYHAFSPDLQRSNLTLFNTINAVQSVFRMNRETLRSVPSMSGESSRGVPVDGDQERRAPVQDDSLLVDVQERGEATVEDDFDDEYTDDDEFDVTPPVQSGTNRAESSSAPTVRFAEVSRGKTTGFVSPAQRFARDLSQRNPIVNRLDVIDSILYAHSCITSPSGALPTDLIDEHIGNITEALRNPDLNLTPDNQNDVLKQLAPPVADAVRVGLGLQNEDDVFLDISQGGYHIQGLPDNVGREACASICGEAILHMVRNVNYIETRENLQQVLHQGILRHVGSRTDLTEVPEAKPFNEVFDEISSEYTSETKQLVKKDFTADDIPEDEIAGMTADDYIVLTAQSRRGGGLNETVLIFLQENDDYGPDPISDRWAIMDSHGTQEKGANRGASVRWFNSQEDVMVYLKDHYKMEADDHISMSKVSVVDKA